MSIAVDFDGVFAELKRLLRELQEFPSPSEVAVSEGGSSKATVEFRSAVARVAGSMSDATDKTIAKLQTTHDAIRAAVSQIAEQDASLADEAKLIVSLLDSAVAQDDDAGSPVSGSGAGAKGGASGGVAASAPAPTASPEPEVADY
ncbi:hypothetical protein [Microbacterium sp. 3J1]|uniref:hypothetical protein n=1 Tax=Microbacterium sp. 3J1 TaxID=861269 RepID=UPI000B144C72|nr:hypothetical protein [Microbacterium sp. 3J1]